MKFTIAVILAVAASIIMSPQAKAVGVYAVDDTNKLLWFDSNTPGTTSSTAITNLPAGYQIVGIDFRTTVRTTGAANPGVGSLWALGTNGTLAKLFVINPSTAVATFVGNLPSVNTSGSNEQWFFGFNPANDTLRIMNFIYNYEVNPNTLATLTQPMTGFPAISGSAYTTASFGGTSDIYFLNQYNDGLATSSNMSTGTYTVLPASGIGFSNAGGLDIDGNLMLMAVHEDVGNKETLYSMNRVTGVPSAVLGTISATPGTLQIRGLAITPTSFPPAIVPSVKVKGPKKITTSKTALLIKGTASSDAGVAQVQYKIGKAKFKKAKGTSSWKFTAKLKPGVNTISIQAIGNNAVKSSITKVKVTVN